MGILGVATGNINGAQLGTGGNITASGNITGAFILGNGSQLTGLPSGTGIVNGNSSVTVPTSNGNVVITAVGNNVANITGLGANITGTLSVSGNANVGNIGATNGVFTNVSGNGSALSSITGANVTGTVANATYAVSAGSATTAGTVTTAAQGNITSVGTLTSVSVSGNANIGNIGTGGLITATGNIQGGNLLTAGVVSATGNVTGNFFIGNGSQLTGIDATAIQNGTANVRTFNNANVTISSTGNANILVVTGTGAVVNGTLSATGNANVGNIGATGVVATTIAGSLTTNAQPNITSTGTLVSLSVSGNANVGNIGGTTGVFTTVAGTLTTAAQPNITSVGTLTSLSSSGNVTGANIITGGIVSATGNVTGNFFIGNGSQLTGIDATAIQNGNSNVRVLANANVTVSSAGNANIVVVTGTGANIAGTLSASGNINGANIITGGIVSATGNGVFGNVSATSHTGTTVSVSGNVTGGNLVTGGLITVTGNANVGNLGTSQLTATGNVAFSGANVSLGAVANLKITGGTANYFLQTDGSGNLVWATSSATVAGAYTFTQASPSTSWVINHNLGYQYVNIQLIDSTGNSFTGRYNYPTITFNNTTHCTVSFDSAQAGYAAVSSGGGAQGPTGPAATIGGSNTQVQFNDAGVLGGSSAFTFNKSSNLVSITSLSISANANVGNIGGSAGVFSTITGNLTTPAQSNITAVGTLVSLSVSGNANVGNLGTGGLVTAIGNVTGANIIATTYNLTGVNTGISAAGSSQGDATALTKAFNVVSTVSAGQGVVLPTAIAGMRITVINTSGATLLVYPASGGAINALATNAGYSLPTLGRLDYIATSTTQWYAMGAIYV